MDPNKGFYIESGKASVAEITIEAIRALPKGTITKLLTSSGEIEEILESDSLHVKYEKRGENEYLDIKGSPSNRLLVDYPEGSSLPSDNGDMIAYFKFNGVRYSVWPSPSRPED